MEGAMDVQGGGTSAGPQAGDGGWDEPPGSSPDSGLHRDTVRMMLAYSVPPDYRRQTSPREGPTLRQAQEELFTDAIDRILEDDLRRPRKQRHTAKRMFERLRDEYGFGRRIHHSQGLRQRESPPDQGDVRSPCPMRRATPTATLARPWWSSAAWSNSPLLHHRPAPQRRLLREGLPSGDHRGHAGRVRINVRLPGRSAPEHPPRQYQAGRGEDTRTRPSSAHPVLHRVSVPLAVPTTRSRAG